MMGKDKSFDSEFEKMAIRSLLIMMFGLGLIIFIAPIVLLMGIFGKFGNEEIYDIKDTYGIILSFSSILTGGLIIKSLSSSIQKTNVKTK